MNEALIHFSTLEYKGYFSNTYNYYKRDDLKKVDIDKSMLKLNDIRLKTNLFKNSTEIENYIEKEVTIPIFTDYIENYMVVIMLGELGIPFKCSYFYRVYQYRYLINNKRSIEKMILEDLENDKDFRLFGIYNENSIVEYLNKIISRLLKNFCALELFIGGNFYRVLYREIDEENYNDRYVLTNYLEDNNTFQVLNSKGLIDTITEYRYNNDINLLLDGNGKEYAIEELDKYM